MLETSPNNPTTQRRILIIRRDNIGDLVCTTPLIAALRKMFPHAHLGALVNSYNAAVLARNPHLNAVHVFTKFKHRAAGVSLMRAALTQYLYFRKLRREHYDTAILARSDFDRKGLMLARLLRIPTLIGFAPPVGGKHSARGLSLPLTPLDAARCHHVESLWPLLKALGTPPSPGPMTVYPATPEQRTPDPAHPAIALHISGRQAYQRLAYEQWLAIVKRLRLTWPNSTLKLFWSPGKSHHAGLPGDDDLAARLIEESSAHLTPCPTQQLDELIDGLARCDFFVGADGGALHLAAALNLLSVCFYKDDLAHQQHWRPWQTAHHIITVPFVGDIAAEVAAALGALLTTQH